MAGEVIGNYSIVKKVGEGGMGAVYLAEHTLLGRPAAIKVLLREMSHRAELVTRFFNEARAASAVKHPGIVEIYDFGYHTDGSAYIVMEYLEGDSLSARLRQAGALPEARAAALCRQICGALAAAHAKGIVHRDLKPDNVFIVRDADVADGERTKVLDFGIAKLSSEATGHAMTRTGMVMGTPSYMSPEQCKGSGKVDHRTDLYALGCILYEMTCGRPPFVAEGPGEVMAQHIYAAPVPPSTLATISPALEHVVMTALAKEPDHRFRSADAMAAALQAALPSMPPGYGATPLAGHAPAQPVATATPFPVHAATPPVGHASPQTTMSVAAGVTAAPPPTGAKPRSKVLIGIVAVAVAAGGVAIALRTGGTEQAPASAPPPTMTGSATGVADPGVAATPGSGATAASAAGGSPSATANDAAATTATTDVAAAGSATTATAGNATGSAAGSAITGTGATASGAHAARAPITIKLETNPPGAEVYRMPQGVRIGVTPLSYPHEPMKGEIVLLLKRRGHRDQVINVPADRDSDQTITLTRAIQRAPAARGSAEESMDFFSRTPAPTGHAGSGSGEPPRPKR